MQLTVQLFAAARQTAGEEWITVQVTPPPRAGDVLAAIGHRLPELQSLLPACRLAVDCQYVAADAEIHPDQQLALIPPVSGG